MKSVNVGNAILFAVAGAAMGFCAALALGLVLLMLVDYNETIVSFVARSHWLFPVIGALIGAGTSIFNSAVMKKEQSL